MAVVDLWLPILVSAAAVWMASAIAWMAMPHHKGEFKGFPEEDSILAALRKAKVPAGEYMIPFCKDPNALKNDPAIKAKFEAGPWGTINVLPKAWGNMGGKMLASFIFYVVVSSLIALLTTLTLHRGQDFHDVFHVTALAGIMSYCLAGVPQAIWFNRPPRAVFASLVDGVVFGLITGAIFTWLWPSAM